MSLAATLPRALVAWLSGDRSVQLARTGGPCPHRHRGRGPRQLGVRQALLPAARLPGIPPPEQGHPDPLTIKLRPL